MCLQANGPFIDAILPTKSLTEYSLHFPDSSLINTDGKENKYSVFNFKTRNFNEFGILILDSTKVYKSKSYVLELMKKDKVVYREKDWLANKLIINRLEAGDYSLRFIEDQNQNGRFDSGDFSKKIQAERVLHYSSTIPIKSNWEFELSPSALIGKMD
jgi:hypothetical protein